MKHIKKLCAIFAALVCSLAQTIEAQQLAFPGAEGFGQYTTGGRGGAVYHVTRLDDDTKEGSFRWACNKSGTRTIVFDVSGTIYLTSELKLRNGNVTIAGQTAPGDGICIADYPFVIAASNVIIRYMRFRLGNRQVANHEGDGLGGMDSKNIIVDHCSVSWSIDECLSVYGSTNTTVQWCIASQSLVNSGHSKGAHGYGGNWGGSGASYHHNLIAHHSSRTPRFGPRQGTQTDERMDYRNNVIYNWGGNGSYGGEGMNVNVVGNYYKPGPTTMERNTNIQKRITGMGIRTTEYCKRVVDADGNVTGNGWLPMWHVWGTLYVTGNYNSLYPSMDEWKDGIVAQIDNSKNDYTFNDSVEQHMHLTNPIDFPYTTTHSAADAYQRVLAYAGASLHRDWIDTAMVYDTRYGKATYTGKGNTAGLINSQDDMKPADADSTWTAWPTLETYGVKTDTDGDGMPDDWEDANGLDKSNATDGKTVASDGYTNLEHYMNSLVADITAAQNIGGKALKYPDVAEDEVEDKAFTLSAATYTESDPSTTWKFDNGFSITNNSDKGWATGTNNTMKLSRNTQFTIVIPEGTEIAMVELTGYANSDGGTAYLQELGGITYSESDFPFPARDAAVNTATHEITLTTPASGTLTFTTSGSTQSALTITLHTSATVTNDNTSAIMTPTADKTSDGCTYDIMGRKVIKAEHGLYIKGGKLIRK